MALERRSHRSYASVSSAFDQVLYYILLACLAARPLISEVFEPIEVSFLTAIEARGGPTPATTATLDTLLLAAAALALGRRNRWRGNRPVATGVLLLLLAVVLSTFVASDKSVALLAGLNLVVVVVGGAALGSLAQNRWMQQLLLAALLATVITSAAKCLNQHFWENRETLQQWEHAYKPQLIAQGVDPADPLLVNFERRMRAGEVYGFLAHPNVAASGLMMGLLAMVGLFRALLRRTPTAPPAAAVALALGVAMALALWLTGSRSAMAAGVLGVGLLATLGRAAPWCARNAGRVLALLALGYLALVGAATAYGLTRDTLPHPSLAFRWYYWTAAARAMHDAPLTGLGRGNFAAAYLQYKSPESTEDVRDPHNLWVSLLTELGPLGFAAGLLLCGQCLRSGLHNLAPRAASDAVEVPVATRAGLAALGVMVIHAVFAGADWRNRGEFSAWVLDVGIPWPLAFAVTVWLVVRMASPERQDCGAPPAPARRAGACTGGACWVVAGLTAALVAALVHSLLDFPLLTPGGLATFVMFAVAARGGPTPADSQCASAPRSGAAPRRRPWPLLVGLAVTAAHGLVVARPVYTTTRALAQIDAAQRQPWPGRAPAVVGAARAGLRRSSSAAVAQAAGRALLHLAARPELTDGARADCLNAALESAGVAIARDARNANHYTLRAAIRQQLAALHTRRGDRDAGAESRRAAAQDWEQATRLNPTSARMRIATGAAWLDVWQRDADADAGRRAAEHFAQALRIDDLRPAYEVVRLRPAERDQAVDALRQLSSASAPASSVQ